MEEKGNGDTEDGAAGEAKSCEESTLCMVVVSCILLRTAGVKSKALATV